MSIHAWAVQWGVPAAAVFDLQQRLGLDVPTLPPITEASEAPSASEARVQSEVRLEGAQRGVRLWRNNVGALIPKDGGKRLVRFGLANDSEGLNEILKSGDLIGWRRVLITPAHVGCAFAQFVSREIKEQGWYYTGQGREVAQKAWADMVNADGGDAGFASRVGTL